jgi:hypothetical protein
MKRAVGMKGRVDKSRGMETLIAEALAKIKPTATLRLAKQAARFFVRSHPARMKPTEP